MNPSTPLADQLEELLQSAAATERFDESERELIAQGLRLRESGQITQEDYKIVAPSTLRGADMYVCERPARIVTPHLP